MSMYTVLPLSSFADQTAFFNFCKAASNEKDPASVNMWDDNWQAQNHTLPFILYKEKRFSDPNGEFFLLLYQTNIVACGGIYTSPFSKDVALAGSRTWINQEHRNKQLARNFLLPAQKSWALKNNFKTIALSFNDYNRNIIEMWKRIRLGEHRDSRKEHHLFFSNFNELEFPVNIQFTKQWVIYEKIDPLWDYDWKTIECK